MSYRTMFGKDLETKIEVVEEDVTIIDHIVDHKDHKVELQYKHKVMIETEESAIEKIDLPPVQSNTGVSLTDSIFGAGDDIDTADDYELMFGTMNKYDTEYDRIDYGFEDHNRYRRTY